MKIANTKTFQRSLIASVVVMFGIIVLFMGINPAFRTLSSIATQTVFARETELLSSTTPPITPGQMDEITVATAIAITIVSDDQYALTLTAYPLTPRTPAKVIWPNVRRVLDETATPTAVNSATAAYMETAYVATIRYIFRSLTPATIIHQNN